MTDDWLVAGNRADIARDRLISCAADLIAQRGVTKFEMNDLARHAHCSRATVYRHVGGRQAVIDAVLTNASADVIAAVRSSIQDVDPGPLRARTAIDVALQELQSDRVIRQFLRSGHLTAAAPTFLASPAVTAQAAELIGIDPSETVAIQFAVRAFLGLLLWPPEPAERDLLIDRLLAASCGESADTRPPT